MNQIQKDAQIKIIISQTNYDYETAENKLKEWKYDFIKVIKEFLNPTFQEKEKQIKKEKNKVVSVNQSIMKELRNFKDIQNKNHDQYKKYRDYLKKEEELSELNKHLLQQQLLKEKLEAQNLEAQKLAQKKAQKLDESLPEEIKL
jgi:uncharacterized membrane protein YgaE (UPF0421/DUF939 family)